MLVGKSEGLSYVTLEPSDDFSAFKQKIENEIKAVDGSDGVLLLADLLGGSPYNAAAMCIDGVHTECLTRESSAALWSLRRSAKRRRHPTL